MSQSNDCISQRAPAVTFIGVLHPLDRIKVFEISLCHYLLPVVQQNLIFTVTTLFLSVSTEELRDIITRAPSFTSGELVHLEISSAPLDKELVDAMPAPQGDSAVPRF